MIPAWVAALTLPGLTQTASVSDPALQAFALLDGSWSLAMTAAWAASAQSTAPLTPESFAGVLVPRFLYGTSWSAVLATNVTLVRAWTGPQGEGIRRAFSRHDWLVGYRIPGGCDGRGCGLGLGGYGEVALALDTRWPWELAMSGGWIQGHHGQSNGITRVESTWVQAPWLVRLRPQLQAGPLTPELVLGVGLYLGMHNAHLHTHSLRREALKIPYHELVMLHGGAGPGLHFKLALRWASVRLEFEGDAAPFWGGAGPELDALAPLLRPAGAPRWRRAAVGLTGLTLGPITLGLRYHGFELSPRPWNTFGHRAWALTFALPLLVEPTPEPR